MRNASLKNEATLLKVLGSLEASRDHHICKRPLTYVDERAHLLTPIAGFQVRQGPLSGLEYHRTVRRRLDAAGFQANFYGSHSLRIGFVAQATVNGATNDDIKRQTGHKSDEILNRYKREVAIHENAVIGRIKLHAMAAAMAVQPASRVGRVATEAVRAPSTASD